jgi:hypothetical protein
MSATTINPVICITVFMAVFPLYIILAVCDIACFRWFQWIDGTML